MLHLANTNEELGGLATAIPPFAKLLWSLLLLAAAAEAYYCN